MTNERIAIPKIHEMQPIRLVVVVGFTRESWPSVVGDWGRVGSVFKIIVHGGGIIKRKEVPDATVEASRHLARGSFVTLKGN